MAREKKTVHKVKYTLDH